MTTHAADSWVAVLVSPQLASCVEKSIPLDGRPCILRFDTDISPKLKCMEIVEETSDVLRRVKSNESTILLGDLNAHIGNDAGAWNGVRLANMVMLT